jgi:hypothetical protein
MRKIKREDTPSVEAKKKRVLEMKPGEAFLVWKRAEREAYGRVYTLTGNYIGNKAEVKVLKGETPQAEERILISLTAEVMPVASFNEANNSGQE